MTTFRLAAALALPALLVLASCSGDSTDPAPVTPPPPSVEYATVVFRLDDSANGTLTAADGPAWCGEFTWDEATGVIAPDDSWAGPFPALHDDGPAAAGGHEADGETAGDHVWTVAVQAAAPEVGWTFACGPTRGSVGGSCGEDLVPDWDGQATVPAGATGTVVVEGPAFIPPLAGAVPVTFVIDDSANMSYTADDGLAWKGSFGYDAASRVLTLDNAWGGPYVPLWDDGPWTAGGHEAADAAAGDHRWSAAVWIANDATRVFEYGAIRGSVAGSDGAWIWTGPNGSFTVTAGADAGPAVQGLTIPAWGTVDVMILIDLSSDGANLPPAWAGVDHTDDAALKGDFTGWQTVPLREFAEIGTDYYGFLLSEHAGPHEGLVHRGDVLVWVMVLGGVEYRVDGAASNIMVMPRFLIDGQWQGGFDAQVQPDGDRNLTITVP